MIIDCAMTTGTFHIERKLVIVPVITGVCLAEDEIPPASAQQDSRSVFRRSERQNFGDQSVAHFHCVNVGSHLVIAGLYVNLNEFADIFIRFDERANAAVV